MKHRPRLYVPPLPDHASSSPSLRPENNLSAREESAVAIANLFYSLQGVAIAAGLTCKASASKEQLREIAEQGIERIEELIKEIEKSIGEIE